MRSFEKLVALFRVLCCFCIRGESYHLCACVCGCLLLILSVTTAVDRHNALLMEFIEHYRGLATFVFFYFYITSFYFLKF